MKFEILNFYLQNNKRIVTDISIIHLIKNPKTATEELLKSKGNTIVKFLYERNKPESWTTIDQLKPDAEPLSKEEIEQLESQEGHMTGEDANREYKTDLP